MRRLLWVLVVSALCVVVGCNPLKSTQDVPRIAKDGLKARLGSPDIELIDVRSRSDWEKSSDKILGARRLDPDKSDSWADTLPKDREIILYCA